MSAAQTWLDKHVLQRSEPMHKRLTASLRLIPSQALSSHCFLADEEQTEAGPSLGRPGHGLQEVGNAENFDVSQIRKEVVHSERAIGRDGILAGSGSPQLPNSRQYRSLPTDPAQQGPYESHSKPPTGLTTQPQPKVLDCHYLLLYLP